MILYSYTFYYNNVSVYPYSIKFIVKELAFFYGLYFGNYSLKNRNLEQKLLSRIKLY
jgi:hypothetical protein